MAPTCRGAVLNAIACLLRAKDSLLDFPVQGKTSPNKKGNTHVLICRIEKNVYGGAGLARVDGMVVFVVGACVGETVEAVIYRRHKNFAEASLTRIIESPYREAGEPDLSGMVPGMAYAPLPPKLELEIKVGQFEEFLRKAGSDVEVEADALPVDMLHYRNKAVYHVEDGRFGYRSEPSHKIVEIEDDPLVRPEISTALAEIRSRVLSTPMVQGASERVTVRWTPEDGVKWWIGSAPRDLTLHEHTCGLDFEVSADGFYQVNPQIGERLVSEVVAEFVSSPCDLLDLYCGVGVFGLCAMDAVRTSGAKVPALEGVESGRGATVAAARNARAARLEARFRCGRVADTLRRLDAEDKTVIIDPPRGGMEAEVAKWLASSGAKRIISVSCDPATFARDLQRINGAYVPVRAKLFNMFPRTADFETVTVLEKNKK